MLATKLIRFDTTDFIIWTICIGVCIALIISHFYKKIAGPFVRTLIAYEHFDEDSAVTLDELKMNKRFLRLMLRSKTLILSHVSVVGGEIPRDENGKLDIASAKFYIEKDKCDKAKCTFSETGRFLGLILTLIVIIALCYGLTMLVPVFVAAAKG